MLLNGARLGCVVYFHTFNVDVKETLSFCLFSRTLSLYVIHLFSKNKQAHNYNIIRKEMIFFGIKYTFLPPN